MVELCECGAGECALLPALLGRFAADLSVLGELLRCFVVAWAVSLAGVFLPLFLAAVGPSLSPARSSSPSLSLLASSKLPALPAVHDLALCACMCVVWCVCVLLCACMSVCMCVWCILQGELKEDTNQCSWKAVATILTWLERLWVW